MKKRTVSILLSLLLMLSLVVTANAAGKINVKAEDASLKLTYADEKTALKGADFEIWKVANVDEYARYTLAEKFKETNVTGILDEDGYFVDQDSEAWKKIGTSLESWITESKTESDAKGETDDNGVVLFDNLTPGVYFVNGTRHSQNGYYYEPVPYLVAVPAVDHAKNEWVYDIDSTVKFNKESIPSDPSESFRVLKVWEMGEGDTQDEEPTIPESITVNVYNEKGKVVRSIKLSDSNNWAKTVALDADQELTFTEPEIDGYTTTIEYREEKGLTYVIITNTWNGLEEPEIPEEPENPAEPPAPPVEPEQPEQPELPATGALWWPVPLMAVLGIACFLMGWMRRRNYEN